MVIQSDGVVEKISKNPTTNLWEVQVKTASKRLVRYIGFKTKPAVKVGEQLKAGDGLE